jgi:hypothetical protein
MPASRCPVHEDFDPLAPEFLALSGTMRHTSQQTQARAGWGEARV